MSAQFKDGDSVILKSGGPKMTIKWIEEDEAYCEWFDSKGEYKGQKFSLTSLKPE